MSGLYDTEEDARAYIAMAEGYDGRALIDVLKVYLETGSTILELGTGPGVDLKILAEDFQVTGSDYSAAFLKILADQNPAFALLELDAVTLETDQTFNAVYSNKVLHHLSADQLRRSFARQREIVKDGARLAFHSFWKGEGVQEIKGMKFHYFEPRNVIDLLGAGWEVVAHDVYEELEPDDSFWLLLRATD